MQINNLKPKAQGSGHVGICFAQKSVVALGAVQVERLRYREQQRAAMSRDSVIYQFVPAYAPLHCLLAADAASACCCSKDLVNRPFTSAGVITAHTSTLFLHIGNSSLQHVKSVILVSCVAS